MTKTKKITILFILALTISSINTFSQTTLGKANEATAQVIKKLANDSVLKNKHLSEVFEVVSGKVNGMQTTNDYKIDTSLKVIYEKKEMNKPAYFINDKFIPEGLLTTFNHIGDIVSVNVSRDSVQIDGVKYRNKILIKTKHPFNPAILSLQGLKEKYTNLKNKSAIFMIDGLIINDESDQYFVDENKLLRIIIDEVKNTKENIDVAIIKILTKSEANMNDLKKIRIRGTDVAFAK